ncbi:MAG TPA: hypothetical protein VHE55_08365 [Fimbriimonadaceae bacterium]|nr:hypothetical protein [Fimbriimonadaceae bacterium]
MAAIHPIRILVLALENYLSAARLPKALADGGFEVAAICYPDALISLTRYVDRKEVLPRDADAAEVARRMIAIIDSWEPRLVIPADNRALRFLHHIVEVERSGVLPPALIRLVKESLPDPAAFAVATDKRVAAALMHRLGFDVPEWRPIASIREAEAFAEEIGFPVILKPEGGQAGEGVAICGNAEDLRAARLEGEGGWFVQRFIVGRPAEASGIAWQGKLLGAILYERIEVNPPETGMTCVARVIENATMTAGLAAMAKATRHNGILSLGWMLEAETGSAFFLEANARSVPIVGPSGKLGLNLCECLRARLAGAPQPVPDPAAPRLIALYPQELHRDPNSPYREHLLDEPVDDPLVHQAMQRGIEMLARRG